MDNIQTLKLLSQKRNDLILELEKNIIGQKQIIDQLFLSILCNGHVLLEGVPGLAKTLLIQTLSEAMDLKFSRIQFTPDLMPSDIIGTEMIEDVASELWSGLPFRSNITTLNKPSLLTLPYTWSTPAIKEAKSEASIFNTAGSYFISNCIP